MLVVIRLLLFMLATKKYLLDIAVEDVLGLKKVCSVLWMQKYPEVSSAIRERKRIE